MKNLYRIFLCLGFVLATTVGCTEVEVEEQTLSTETAGTFRVIAGVPSSDTKVDVDGLTVTWNESDEIAIAEVGENGEFVAFHTYLIDAETISEDGKYAEFVGNDLTAGKSYIAYNYVYTGYLSTWAQCDVTKNFFCVYGYSYFDHNNVDLMMQSNIFEYDGKGLPQLSFEHKSSLLELEIELESGSEYEGEIESITISSGSTVAFLTDLIFNSYGQSVYAFFISSGEQGDASSSIDVKLTESVEFGAESPVSIKVPVTWNGYITEAEGDFSFTIKTADGKESTVTKPMQVLIDGARYSVELTFEEPAEVIDMAEVDRAALIDLYNSTGGDNWSDKTNWCTDTSLSEWSGVSTDESGRVVRLDLTWRSLTGSIPESIGDLTSLTYLDLGGNSLSGSIPDEIGELVNVEYMSLCLNELSGDIPSSIGNINKLSTLNLCYCNLEGELPESIGFLPNLNYLYLGQNRLSGVIPDSYATDQDFWNRMVWDVVPQQSDYGFDSYPTVYVTPTSFTTYAGLEIETSSFFAENSLVCVLDWVTWCYYTYLYIETLKELYNTYNIVGFDVLGSCYQDDIEYVQSYVDYYSVPWHIYQIGYYDGSMPYFPYGAYPMYHFVDSTGAIVFSGYLDSTGDLSREDYTRQFVTDWFNNIELPDAYQSTDYSKDGEVVTLQTATVGTGIDLVIVGDGFVDSDMGSGGVYETRMSEAMEHFFSEEPYTTYRDRYNVYAVKAVSKHEGVNGVSETVFGAEFGEGTAISGDDLTVFEYALKVPSITSWDNLTVLAVLNSYNYAGTCYMYTNDASVSYCPIVYNNDEQFRQIITHECGGHGFAKLLDEYAYTGTIPDSEIESFEWMKSVGWGANVDVTSDPDTIQWSHLLSDARYEGLVGIYEGALTYTSGAYRPTDVSIMRYNTDGYNAPSREEIYRRIMVLSGDEYDYEEFVAYDAINRSASTQTTRAAQANSFFTSSFTPLAQPVIVHGAPKPKKRK